ncbi:hypothetical protein N2152v2_006692 [Parachlorella kessleri]
MSHTTESAPLAQLPKPAPVAKTPVAKTKSQALSTYFSPARVLPQFVAALLVMELLRVAVGGKIMNSVTRSNPDAALAQVSKIWAMTVLTPVQDPHPGKVRPEYFPSPKPKVKPSRKLGRWLLVEPSAGDPIFGMAEAKTAARAEGHPHWQLGGRQLLQRREAAQAQKRGELQLT